MTSLGMLGLALMAMFVRSGIGAREAPDRPNVLMILVDDLGFGDLSSFGAPDLQTPNIDALVASGLRFSNAYANCPVCSPTRAALLSGRTPDLVGVPGVIRTHKWNNWGYLDPDVPLLPALLREVGYHTAIVGKWHLGLESPNTPGERGFDHVHGFLGDMMDDYYTHRRHDINYMRLGDTEIDPEGHATDLFSDWAIDYLNSRKDEPNPFFLYLAYNAPHTPIQPPEDWVDRVRRREPGIDEKRARLVALIEHLDDGIGRVFRALDANGQAESTLVVFASDNGGQLDVGARCGPYRGGKGDLYEGGIRIPMAARWPGQITPGSSTDHVTLTMDLMPTVCELAGATIPAGTTGRSLVPLLLGRSLPEDNRALVFVRREGGPRYLGQDYFAIRQGPWKLVQNHPFEPFQLYNLDADPRETQNLIKQEPSKAQLLSQALMMHLQQAGQVPWQRPERPEADGGGSN
ncbi:sulfatase-like hydrolase/transferase [Tautonia rosea]|uniref:sulfatase-like hydrolase/transferase n=1 Tax=Tautonia rosea TaxID=2728037 RepID=UPI0014739D44